MVTYAYDYKRTVIRGDSDKFRVTFAKKKVVNGYDEFEPIDITGWNVRFTVRPEAPSSEVYDDTDALIAIDAIIVDPENGVAIVYVPAEETTKLDVGTYYYDIQYIKPRDDFGYNEVHSIRKAKYVIIGDITRDIDYTIDGGNAIDFEIVDETDYIVVNNVDKDEEGNAVINPVVILDPCKGLNGASAEDERIDRVIDGGNARLDIEVETYKNRKPNFFDPVEDEADDGYEI